MVKDNNLFVNTLKILGFSSSEISIYKVLVENDYLIVSDISKLSNVPRSKAYEILTKLELKQVVQKLDGRPLKYRARNPDQVLKKIKKELFEDTEYGLELIQESWMNRESIDELRAVSVYYGANNYFKIFKKIENEVKFNIFFLLPYLVNLDEIQLVKNIIKSNWKKGIKIEIVFHPSVFNQLDASIQQFFLEKSNLKIATVPIRAIFLDHSEMIIQIPSADKNENFSPEDIQNVIIKLSDLVGTIEKSIRASINQSTDNQI